MLSFLVNIIDYLNGLNSGVSAVCCVIIPMRVVLKELLVTEVLVKMILSQADKTSVTNNIFF